MNKKPRKKTKMTPVTKTKTLTKITNNSITFSDDQVELLKNTLAKGSTNDEFQMFLYQCQRTGLDPFARQIYFMKRGGKVSIEASIDGLRLVAKRSGEYAGQDEPEWFKTPKNEMYAKVAVYCFAKDGQRYKAAVGVAYWSEYCPQKPNDFMWQKMPRTMIAKCAEALALRKAFPQELSGIYSSEEMEQIGQGKDITEVEAPIKSESEAPIKVQNPSNSTDSPRKAELATPVIQEAQRRRIFVLGQQLGYDSEQTKKIIKDYFKVDSFTDLSFNQAAKIIEVLVKKIQAKAAKAAEEPEQEPEAVDGEVVSENEDSDTPEVSDISDVSNEATEDLADDEVDSIASEIFTETEDKPAECYLTDCHEPRVDGTYFCSPEHKAKYWEKSS